MPNGALSAEESEFLEFYYRKEYEGLFRYALHLLGNASLAEVAVQNTFVIAARRISTLMAHENPVGWLYVVMKYTICEMRRDQAAVKERCVPLEDVPEQFVPMEEPEALDRNDPDIELLQRFYVDGFSLKELAAEYETTVAALKMRICRLKKRLRNDPKIRELKDFFD